MTKDQYRFSTYIYRKPKPFKQMCRYMRMSQDQLKSFAQDEHMALPVMADWAYGTPDTLVFFISTTGKIAVEKRRRERFWRLLPYATSLVFSLLALILSIIAILSELGLLPLQSLMEETLKF